LFDQHCPCEPQECFGIREDTDNIGSSFDFFIDAFY